MNEALLDVSPIADEIIGNQKIDAAKGIENEYFNQPTHAAAARVLEKSFNGRIIFEKGTGKWYEKTPAGYYDEIEEIQNRASRILDRAAQRAFNRSTENLNGSALQAAYIRAGTARKRAQTREFISSTLAFLSESVQVPKLASKWNATPETLPTISGILDFSGPELKIRPPHEEEYYRAPLPVDAEVVLKADVAPAFSLALLKYFPDTETQRTALECLSLAVANTGSRVFQLWYGEAGANGKNTLIDMLRVVLPGRVGTISAAAITRGLEGGAKRFGSAELEGLTFAAVDEVNGAFDVSEVKRITGGSTISVERKGQNPHEIPQRWTLAALTNKLPSFSPATDTAFLQRLIIIPFDAVFYFNDVQREEYLRLGIDESRLKPAGDKDKLLSQIEIERPAIIRYLIDTYVQVRKGGGRPYECARSLLLKQQYQNANDLVAQFFLEHFERKETGRVEYARLIDLWKEYTGDKSASIREVTKKLMERFPWLSKDVSHSRRFLIGMREIDELNGDEPKHSEKNAAEPEEISSSTSGKGTEVRKTPLFNSEQGKSEKPFLSIETPQFRTSVPETQESAIQEPGPDLETASTIYDDLLELYDTQAANLKRAEIPEDRARVTLDEWRIRVGTHGILSERFSQSYQALLENGLIRFEDPHVYLTSQKKDIK